MSLDAAVRSYVLGDSQIAMLVGTRMYPVRLPEKATLPAISYQRISDVRGQHLRGVAGLARARYQVDCYASKHPECVALGALVRQRLDGFSGAWTVDSDVSPPTTVRVSVFFETAMDLFDEDILGGSCRQSADYFVWHGTASGEV